MTQRESVGGDAKQPSSQPQYLVLSQDEMDEMVVNKLLAEERDLFAHRLTKERLEAMLPRLPDGDFKQHCERLLESTNARIAEVQAIIDATMPQLPNETRRAAALDRIRAKERAAQAAKE